MDKCISITANTLVVEYTIKYFKALEYVFHAILADKTSWTEKWHFAPVCSVTATCLLSSAQTGVSALSTASSAWYSVKSGQQVIWAAGVYQQPARNPQHSPNSVESNKTLYYSEQRVS